MHRLFEKPVATFDSNGLKTEIYPVGSGGETTIEISSKFKLTTIKYRNVGEKNPESAIQFVVEEYNRHTNRSKLISFSIPDMLCDLFIKNLQQPK